MHHIHQQKTIRSQSRSTRIIQRPLALQNRPTLSQTSAVSSTKLLFSKNLIHYPSSSPRVPVRTTARPSPFARQNLNLPTNNTNNANHSFTRSQKKQVFTYIGTPSPTVKLSTPHNYAWMYREFDHGPRLHTELKAVFPKAMVTWWFQQPSKVRRSQKMENYRSSGRFEVVQGFFMTRHKSPIENQNVAWASQVIQNPQKLNASSLEGMASELAEILGEQLKAPNGDYVPWRLHMVSSSSTPIFPAPSGRGNFYYLLIEALKKQKKGKLVTAITQSFNDKEKRGGLGKKTLQKRLAGAADEELTDLQTGAKSIVCPFVPLFQGQEALVQVIFSSVRKKNELFAFYSISAAADLEKLQKNISPAPADALFIKFSPQFKDHFFEKFSQLPQKPSSSPKPSEEDFLGNETATKTSGNNTNHLPNKEQLLKTENEETELSATRKSKKTPALDFSKQKWASTAFWKLLEAMGRLGATLSHRDKVLDLGCSPGGWSQVCLTLGAQVVGLDKARPHPAVEKKKGFEFLQEDVLTFDFSQAALHKTGHTPEDFNWLICDIITTPEVTLDLFLRVFPLLPNLAFFVVTFKWKKFEEIDAAPIEKRLKRFEEANPHVVCYLKKFINSGNEITLYGNVNNLHFK